MIIIKIIQVLPTLSYGDAVSNDTMNMNEILEKSGYDTAIYTENIDKRLLTIVKRITDLSDINKEDIIIYHKAIGTKLSYELDGINCKKIMRYHNITPGTYFKKYNKTVFNLVEYGREGLEYASKYIDYSFADSSYNMQELVELNYKNVEVLPILISFDDYAKTPDKKTIEKYNDGVTNMLFVGRIAPNKSQEDVIKSFYYYKKYVNQNSRLIFVGSDNGFENYSDLLKKLVNELELKDVIFTGHIKFEEILSYYKVADLFLCMSEHEGFCVPLVESMYFGVPILAYDSSAVGETLGSSGVLVKEKNYFVISELMDRIMTDKILRDNIVEKQYERLKDFALEKVEKQFIEAIEKIIKA